MNAILAVLALMNLVGLVLLWLHIDRSSGETRQLGARVSQLETSIAYLPTHRELAEIRNALGTLANSVAGLAERSESTSEMVHSIQQYLMEKNG